MMRTKHLAALVGGLACLGIVATDALAQPG